MGFSVNFLNQGVLKHYGLKNLEGGAESTPPTPPRTMDEQPMDIMKNIYLDKTNMTKPE